MINQHIRFCALSTFALLATLCCQAAAIENTRQPNVLFIIADDLNCDIGAYGDTRMKTPNIDRLAARGRLFTRAYTQYPLCGPSRASLLTGRRPDVTGVTSHRDVAFRKHIPDTVTLPELFKQHDWTAVRIGKLFHYAVPAEIGTSGEDDPQSWSRVFNPRGRDCKIESRIFSLKPGVFGGTLSWYADPEGKDTGHTDGIGATEAIRQLEELSRKPNPFFLALGFYRPHTPYVAPQRYFDLYPPENISLPSLSDDDRTRTPAPAFDNARNEQDAMTDDQRRLAIQGYHAAISFMDAQVGRVLDALDRLGLAGNTIIVFTSDHGYHLADHGLWQKPSMFERCTRVPLIIATPGMSQPGRQTQNPTELVDLYPTLAELSGLAAPEYLAGKSLVPVLQNPDARVKTAAFSQGRRSRNGPDGRAIRTDRWRYAEFGVDGADGKMLFDEDNDPAESVNLVRDPRFSAVVATLQTQLRSTFGEGAKPNPGNPKPAN